VSTKPNNEPAIVGPSGDDGLQHRYQLDRKAAGAKSDLVKSIQAATEQTGKSPVSQAIEIASLTFGRGKISATEYFDFRLYDDENLTQEEKRRFVGDSQFGKIADRTCHPLWRAVTMDKIVSDQLLRAFDIPVPELVAAYAPGHRECGVPTLRDERALAQFLRSTQAYPLFAKPVNGVQSWGVWSLTDYDADADVVGLLGGESISPDALAGEIDSVKQNEYLFQRTLETHPEVRGVTGLGLSTIRQALIWGNNGPESLGKAVWKISSGANPADNFWREGNMLAALDIDGGTVIRVIRGIGPDMEKVEAHPDTGAPLVGFKVPYWQEAQALAKKCAGLFPKLGFTSTDIAITSEGPVVVEVNSGSAFSLFQLAYGRGFLTDQFVTFLETWKHQEQPPS